MAIDLRSFQGRRYDNVPTPGFQFKVRWEAIWGSKWR